MKSIDEIIADFQALSDQQKASVVSAAKAGSLDANDYESVMLLTEISALSDKEKQQLLAKLNPGAAAEGQPGTAPAGQAEPSSATYAPHGTGGGTSGSGKAVALTSLLFLALIGAGGYYCHSVYQKDTELLKKEATAAAEDARAATDKARHLQDENEHLARAMKERRADQERSLSTLSEDKQNLSQNIKRLEEQLSSEQNARKLAERDAKEQRELAASLRTTVTNLKATVAGLEEQLATRNASQSTAASSASQTTSTTGYESSAYSRSSEIKDLITHLNNLSGLSSTAKIFRNKLLQLLPKIQQGASVSSPLSGETNTPLHYACGLDDVMVVEWLLKEGANPRALNKQGQTPADCAIGNNSTNALNCLREHDAVY